MRIPSTWTLVLMTFALASNASAGPDGPVCEQGLVGRSYECIAKLNDPQGICIRRCITVLDSDEDFDLEVDDGFADQAEIFHCSCAEPREGGALGPRWFECVTGDGHKVARGKVTRAGRRIRKGFTSYMNDAVTDDFSCKRSTSCVAEFGLCTSFGLPAGAR